MVELQDFSQDFFETILDELQLRGGNAEQIFVDKMVSYLSDHMIVENVHDSSFQKTALGVKVNSYSYDDKDQVLTLFVAIHDMPYDKPRTVGKADVERAAKRLLKFYNLSLSGKLSDIIEESSQNVLDLSDLILQNSKKLRQLDLYVLANGIYRSNEAINVGSVPSVDEVNCYVWDLERVFQLIGELTGTEDFTINMVEELGETFDMLMVPAPSGSDASFDCFVGYIPATLLAKAYKLKGSRLIERNVRSFLQAKGKVNKGIKTTLEREPNKFIAYNNGISTTAEGASMEQISENPRIYRIESLKNWQIVNGGQTTASMHHVWDSGVDLTRVYVQAKLTLLKDMERSEADNLISRVSQYANTQNKIALSDLGANHSFQVELEQISRHVWAPDPSGRKSELQWYYERARGQYLVDLYGQPTRSLKAKFKAQHPKSHLITKTQVARYFMAWERLPHIVSKGGETSFDEFMKFIATNRPQCDANFYKNAIARALVFTGCDDVLTKMDIPGFKANVVAYSVSMLSVALDDKGNSFLANVWNQQSLSDDVKDFLERIALITRDYFAEPAKMGVNISQLAKKEECWAQFKACCVEQVLELFREHREISAGLETSEVETIIYSDDPATPLLTYLQSKHHEVVDKRSVGGSLWIIDAPGLEELLVTYGKDLQFNYAPNGSKSTNYRAAWYWCP